MENAIAELGVELGHTSRNARLIVLCGLPAAVMGSNANAGTERWTIELAVEQYEHFAPFPE